VASFKETLLYSRPLSSVCKETHHLARHVRQRAVLPPTGATSPVESWMGSSLHRRNKVFRLMFLATQSERQTGAGETRDKAGPTSAASLLSRDLHSVRCRRSDWSFPLGTLFLTTRPPTGRLGPGYLRLLAAYSPASSTAAEQPRRRRLGTTARRNPPRPDQRAPRYSRRSAHVARDNTFRVSRELAVMTAATGHARLRRSSLA
jgi:hypothetical protein